MSKEENRVEGLGGWLIFVGLGIIFSPIRSIMVLYPIYKEIFVSGTWEMVTTQGTEFYNVLWAPFLISEIVINVLVMFTWIYIAYLFFTKKKRFPKMFIGMIIFTIVFIVLDAFAIQLVLPDEPVFDTETTRELYRSIISGIIWIPYMLLSKRVKATFVN